MVAVRPDLSQTLRIFRYVAFVKGNIDLSVSERIELVEAIWDSIPEGESMVEVPEAHKRLLDERLAAHQANPTAGSSWENVRARIEEKLS